MKKKQIIQALAAFDDEDDLAMDDTACKNVFFTPDTPRKTKRKVKGDT